MLKWAVNGTRQTYLQNEDKYPKVTSTLQQHRKHLKRKSSELIITKSRVSWHDKENQYTSTPLQTCNRSFVDSPSCTIDTLSDLSNIVAEIKSSNSPLRLCANKESPKAFKTPENTQIRKDFPNNYTSTLPTFDAEYSPCALIPGPMLALRGVGVPDSYFKKPRYITPHFQTDLHNANEEPSLEIKTLPKPSEIMLKEPNYIEESTLSSTKMGDVTLERMIDAILESNRKESKPQKAHKHPEQKKFAMSPTYTPAEDPASDLQEVWDSRKARYRQKKQKIRTTLTKKILFNEREINSPLLIENLDPGQLRRQRCLRRKRKINKFAVNVLNSAQKLLAKGEKAQSRCDHCHNLRKVFNAELIHDEIQPHRPFRNLSPDSGHNSSSDYDEERNNSTLQQCMADDNKTLDNTKRKLSFSSENLIKI